MYDLLYGKTLEEQKNTYKAMGKQYHEVELKKTDRPFMPMFAELSPRFAQKFPQIANTFDNLHMLHDLVNDILASDWMSEQQKAEQIQRAIWLVMAKNHEGMEAGKNYGGDGLHDHRFVEGIPGMGLMPEGVNHQGHESPPVTPPKEPEGVNHQGHESPPVTPPKEPEGVNHQGHESPATEEHQHHQH